MKKKVKKVNVLGPRLKHMVQRTFNAVMRNKSSIINISCVCDSGGSCGQGGACGSCSSSGDGSCGGASCS